MNALNEILVLVLDTLVSLYIIAILLRFLLQLVRADFYNPLSQAIVKITNPLLIPVRKVIPGLFGVDIAAITLAWAFQFVLLFIIVLISTGHSYPIPVLLIVSFFDLFHTAAYIGYGTALVLVIASFIAPYSQHPILVLAHQLLEPVLRPIRNVIPPLGGLDFSILFFFLGLRVVHVLIDAVRSTALSAFS